MDVGFLRLNPEFTGRDGHGLAAEMSAVGFDADGDGAASCGELAGGHFRFAEFRGPIRSESAVSRAGNWVFIDSSGRSEETGDEIEIL